LIHWPMIQLVPRPLAERAAALDRLLRDCDGVFFPSPFAVRCLAEAVVSRQDDRAVRARKLVAVGPSTAREIEQMGWHPALAADDFGGVESLAAKAGAAWRGTYFYPCSDQAPAAQRTARLAECGMKLEPAVFYENRPAQPGPLPSLAFHRIVFTSPSTVQAFFERYPDERRARREWLAIGPSTLEALGRMGLKGAMIDEE